MCTSYTPVALIGVAAPVELLQSAACDEACAGIHCCRQHVGALERVHRVRRVCGRMSDLRNAMYL